MLAFVVHSDVAGDKLGLIKQLLSELGCEVRTVDSIEAALGNPEISGVQKSIAIIPETGDAKQDIQEIARHAARTGGHVLALYVAHKISPEDYKSLLRLGWADSTDWDAALREINFLVERARNGDDPHVSAPAGASHHRVISYVGMSGGPGNTTIAMETAICLATLRGKEAGRVALLDLETADSRVCDYLDITPRLDWAEIARSPGRLDDHMLSIFAARHASGLDLFAPREPVPSDLVDDLAVLTLLNRLAESYDTVIIDIPTQIKDKVDEILRNSDCIALTGLYSVPSVRQLHKMIQRLRDIRIPPSRTAVIITDVEKNFLGMVNHRFDASKLLTVDTTFYVRRDRAFAMQCADEGVSMIQTQPSKGICHDIAKIADHIKGVAPATLMWTA